METILKEDRQDRRKRGTAAPPAAGLAGWLLAKLGKDGRSRPHLRLLERIALAPRQSLALVEAEGRRFLVATSAEGAPAFYPLDEHSREPRLPSHRPDRPERNSSRSNLAARVSW